MKKTIYLSAFLGAFCFVNTAFAQLQDEKNVTITMDLQPILQLSMNTSDQIDFVFDDIADYYGGITKYGATILKVSSTVSWDLYAVGTSNTGVSWDLQMEYGSSAGAATNVLPISALELHQSVANTNDANAAGGSWTDYSTAFAAAPYTVGQNSIYASATPYTLPGAAEKYIQGHQNVLDFNAGGSYLTQGALLTSNFYYAIDYRIVPGLPATFPTAGTNAAVPVSNALVAPAYAHPGVYTMNVKYVLLENQ